MTEQAVNSVTAAVTGELSSRVFSGLIQMYGEDAATSEKLQRLEMLLIKIHSVVEASEKHGIKNSWLLRWHDKLKEAASQGNEVLARFLQPAKDAQATSSAEANQQEGEAACSSAAASAIAVGALSFTRKSRSGIVLGICSARKMLFSSSNDDIERLNKTLGMLEKLSPDIGEFINLLRLEALPKRIIRQHGPRKTMRKKRSTPNEEKAKRLARVLSLSTPREEKTKEVAGLFQIDELGEPTLVIGLECDSSFLQKEQQYTLLQDRLETAFTKICKAVELADSHDLEDLEWLASWAGILREAKQQGCAVLGAISANKTINAEDNEESALELDQEKDELSGFVHRLEGLASDVEYFDNLVDVCQALSLTKIKAVFFSKVFSKYFKNTAVLQNTLV